MRKFLNLLKNERIKATKTASFIVLLIIVILVSGLYAFFSKFMDSASICARSDSYYSMSYDDALEYSGVSKDQVSGDAKIMFNHLNEIEKQNSQVKKYRKKYASVMDSELGGNAAGELISGYTVRYLIECVKSAKRAADITVAFYSVNFGNENADQGVTSFLTMDKASLDLQNEKNEKFIEKYEDLVYNENFQPLFDAQLAVAKNNLAQSQNSLEIASDKVKNNPSSGENVEAYRSQQAVRLYTYLTEHTKNFTDKNWVRETAQSILTRTYNLSPENYSLLRSTEQEKDTLTPAKNELEREFYSLNNSKPIPEICKSTRYNLLFSMSMFTFIGFICIIIGGSIVSKEYSSGTIRLLLLGPVSRTKILLSKVGFTVILGFMLALLSQIITVLCSLFIYGGSDLAVPILLMSGGKIHELNFFLYWIGSFLLSFITVLEVSCFAIFLSTLLKNTAFAVGISIFLSMIRDVVVAVAAALQFDWLKYTTLPYGNFSQFVLPGDSLTNQLAQQMSFTYNPAYGACTVLAVSALFIFFSCLIFSRRQVK